MSRWLGNRESGTLRVSTGPGPLGPTVLVDGRWSVSVMTDRAGVRLDGAPITTPERVASMGLPERAVQVPPDGRPIVMLADRQVRSDERRVGKECVRTCRSWGSTGP